jgi:hypothetical protein
MAASKTDAKTGEIVDAGDALEAFDLWSKSELNRYYTQTRDDLDSPVDFDTLFAESGLSEEQFTFGGSAYRVLSGAQKSELVNRPIGLRAWRFKRGDMGGYVIVFGVLHGTNEQVIFTDGSSGVYKQLSKITTDRLGNDHPAPFEFLKVPNGLRVSEYGLNAEGRPAADDEEVVGKGRTYYLAS